MINRPLAYPTDHPTQSFVSLLGKPATQLWNMDWYPCQPITAVPRAPLVSERSPLPPGFQGPPQTRRTTKSGQVYQSLPRHVRHTYMQVLLVLNERPLSEVFPADMTDLTLTWLKWHGTKFSRVPSDRVHRSTQRQPTHLSRQACCFSLLTRRH
jgi:hypothetical protein